MSVGPLHLMSRRSFVAASLCLPATGGEARAAEAGLGPVDVVARKLAFPEGPLATGGGTLYFVQILGGEVCRYGSSGVQRVAGSLVGPNGLALGPGGALFVTQNGGRPDVRGGGRVQRLDLANGAVRSLYDSYRGRPLDGPNDLVFDSSGGFYFTDFIRGSLYWAKPDGAEIRLVDDGLAYPNGIALSPDGKTLYVACTPSRLISYAVTAPGEVAQAQGRSDLRVLCDVPGDFHYDSMKVGADGDLYVAAWQGGVMRYSPDGKLRAMWTVPGYWVTNLSFGGPDRRSLYMTALVTPPGAGRPGPPGQATPAWGAGPPPEGVLLKARSPAAGLPLNFN